MPSLARHRYEFRSIVGWVFCMGLCAVAAPAHADFLLGADLDTALPVKSPAGNGGGFAVRLGYHVHVPFAALTSELGFTYDGFSGGDGDDQATVYRGLAGLRLGIGEIFRIGGFAHVGLAHLESDPGAAEREHTGFSYDLGVLLEFTAVPFLNIGAHAAYNQSTHPDGEPFQWTTIGGHVDFIL